MDKNKYVVVKAEDVRWRGRTDVAGSEDMPQFASITTEQVIEDAVVIRKQDTFAPPALYAYANSIGVTASTLRESSRPGDDAWNTASRLQEIADFFAQAAEDAAALRGKLPD